MTDAEGLFLGAAQTLSGRSLRMLRVPVNDLVTHSVVVGMTGSGKTGLVLVMVEEALRARVPVLVFDIKGDLPNLLLAFPDFDAAHFEPWTASFASAREKRSPAQVARALAEQRQRGLEGWKIGEKELRDYHENTRFRLITPGGRAGERLHILSGLERHSERWQRDYETAHSGLAASVSLVLRLLKRDADPATSRDHVLLTLLAERRLVKGEPADLTTLLHDVLEPPIDRVGALPIDEYLPVKDRRGLANALNTLLAAPSFSAWREGASLDVAEWLAPIEEDGKTKTPAVIVSTAHLDEEERSLVLSVVLEQLLSWTLDLSGSQQLRALVVFDEVYGFLPPHPANPPTKRPLVMLLKQARAFGVGVVLATQNPMDLDYRALSNAGMWAVGRLQTDADRERVLEGLSGEDGMTATELSAVVKRLGPRWFMLRNTHAEHGTVLLQARWAMSWMRGPMTRAEIRAARALRSDPDAQDEPDEQVDPDAQDDLEDHQVE